MPFNKPIPKQVESAKRQPQGKTGLPSLVQAEKLFQIAVLLPAASLIGYFAGAWLDGKLHQTWIGLTGILLGGIGGLIYVIRLVMTSSNGTPSGRS